MRKKTNLDGGIKDAEAVWKENPEFVNLTYDSGFKIVFGTEGRSERLLMLMLNRLLGMKVVNVKYLPTERLGLSAEESKSFFDVYCKDASGLLSQESCLLFFNFGSGSGSSRKNVAERTWQTLGLLFCSCISDQFSEFSEYDCGDQG